MRQRRGAVSLIVAITLPVLAGVAGLSIEFGNGLLTKVSNQRVADAAAYAGALAYASTPTAAAVEAAADRVAEFNGIPAAGATSSFGVSPRGNGNNAVQVVVTTRTSYFLSRLLGAAPSLAIPAASTAEITADAPGCIFALGPSPATGVTLSGGTTVTAPSCSVASNNSASAPCGTTLTSLSLSYNGSAPLNGCGSIRGPGNTAPKIVKKEVADPLATSASVQTAAARLAAVAAMTSPAAPSAPAPPAAMSGGPDIDFAYNFSTTDTNGPIKKAQAIGCTATYASPVWTFNCGAGTRTFGTITVGGGLRLAFAPTSPPANVYNFRNALNAGVNGTTGWTFGRGTYNFAGNVDLNATTFASGTWTIGGTLNTGNSGTSSFGNGNLTVVGSITSGGGSTFTFGTGAIAVGGSITNGSSGAFTIAGAPSISVRGGIINSGSSTMTLPASTYSVGQGSISCGGGFYSICTTNGPIVINGPSSYALTSGVYVTGGGRVQFTGGTTNSYRLGRGSTGYGIAVGGGATLSFADATGATSLFEMNGPISYTTGGGSCLTLPAAANHDINGSLDAAGGIVLGGGTYTVNGIVAFGRTGGGAVTCGGVAVAAKGTGVTFVVSGINPPAGSCADMTSWSFCVTAGYNNIDLTAPTGGSLAKLLVIGPQGAGNTTGASFGGGATNVNLSGAFYYPKGPVQLGGGSGVGNKAGQCLTLVGTQVSLTGGAVVASACISGATGASKIVMVR